MATEVEIGITTIENTIEITSQSTDQVVDIGVTDNRDEVTINVTPTVIEININKNIPAENNLVTSVNTRIGDVVIDANDVGLGNVDNTGDFQKPVSIDVQAALNVKADLIDGLVPVTQLPVTALSVMSGLSQGGVLSINTNTAKFNVSAGFGYIVNGHTNPDVPIKTRVTIAASTANVLPNIGSTPQTFVAIDINGVLKLTPNPLTPTERRNFIRLGVIIHLNNTTIEFIDNQPTVNIEVGGQVQDLLEAFGFRSLSGNRIFPVSTNLKIKKELGKAFKSGANFRNLSTQPHTFTLAAQDPITFRYRTQTGAESSDLTDINPGIFDSNGTSTAMPATATLASIQRIFIFQDGLIRIQLGQRFFNNLNEAITAINSDVFITDSDISENGLYLGAIVMIRGTTNLSLLSQAVFVPSSGVSANGSTSAAPLGYTAEDAANKQNSLVVDGTAAKYPTVDATNAGLDLKANISGENFTGDIQIIKNDVNQSAFKLINNNTPATSLFLGAMGTTAQGISIWESKAVIESGSGLIISSYNDIEFTRGGSRTKIASIDAAGNYTGGITAGSYLARKDKGNTIYLIGDSFIGLDVYQTTIEEKLGVVISTIDGLGGSCIASGKETAEGDGVTRPSFVSRIGLATASSEEIILIQTGGNDFHYNVPLGEYGSTDNNTFYGALENMLRLASASGKRVKITTPIFRNDSQKPTALGGAQNWDYILKYAEAIQRVALKYSVVVIDQFAGSGISTENISAYTIDGIHPSNTKGKKAYGDFMVDNFNSQPTGQLSNVKPYKVYTALLSQTGTSAPVISSFNNLPFENTLGGAIVWTRASTGSYLGTLNGAFTVDKTFVTIDTGELLSAFGENINIYKNLSLNAIGIQTVKPNVLADDVLKKSVIEIRVYN
jgi:hypothetical protein